MDAAFNWPPLESNPEVFTKYLLALGLPGDWFVSEVFGLDEDCLGFVPRPVAAVIVTFESLKKLETDAPEAVTDYYMKQTPKLDYACGVIACIHAVLNNLDKLQLVEHSILAKFYDATKAQTPADRALTLETMREFQEVHKAHANEGQTDQAANGDDVKHHFIAFVRNSRGQLVELDGMKKSALVVDDACSDLLLGAANVLQARVAEGYYSESLAVLTLSKVPLD
ncbi:hypothetical protein SDRG_00696 [Saprolegnia diclina VS20]|uniref:Ubiquitin carboxyl-terminal hydrolase n=1 Tax=Saprolegnia diclina (strain VS20) TaxID=1156394 RepID=T0SFQ0_SAPDV|nr:hypothetical protein SDRG_00696 [Saprolegnia diclina VS20]EQC41837.1 hypothetical protein SDRG_00696 [Saprolegnia diclina VS20]|eukprot:XP_008604406.1 hypothetical protein SDRG_00696 [Saprolegnia diclina VS20]